MKIWVHTLVKNEERYLWFAIKSVVDYVDKILLWDTGSTDKTVEIIKLLKRKYPKKISFKEVGNVDINGFTKIRQKMLDNTKSDWVMILDGDEVWWKDSIKNAREIIEKKGKELDSLVHRYYNIIGDIYHYQEEKAGRYYIDNEMGHLTIRFFNRKIPGIHFSKPHGTQGIFDKNGMLIQERDLRRRLHTNDYYMHFTNMIRSSSKNRDNLVPKREKKLKCELGIPFPKNFKYPEVFYEMRPNMVPDPWKKRSTSYFMKALIQTPLKKVKRRIGYDKKAGY